MRHPWNLTALGCAILVSMPAWPATPEQAVKETLEGYERAWTAKDAHAVASFYFEPAMRVSRGGPTVRPSRADQEAFFREFLRSLVERGFSRSEFESLEVRMLDARTAIASGIVLRYKDDGALLDRVAVTYDLTDTPEGWKIFVSATHPADAVLHFR